MPFANILGNRAAHERLRELVERRRVAHAFLFAGPSGIGKRMAAREFARMLLCRKQGCGTCEDCRRAEAGHHAGLILVSHGEESRDIKVVQMRELLQQLSFTYDGRRVVIVDEAERMNEESQNTFLKTLEEPPAGVVMILLTALPALLLPTIVSRCQTVLFTPLATADMAAFLRTLKLTKAHEALVLALADGLPGRAAELAPQAAEVAERAAELLGRLATGDLNAVIEEIGKIRDTEEARERAREELTVTALALREVLRGRELGEPANLCPPALLKRLETVDSEALAERIESVLEHLRFIEQNANVTLTVEDALLRI